MNCAQNKLQSKLPILHSINLCTNNSKYLLYKILTCRQNKLNLIETIDNNQNYCEQEFFKIRKIIILPWKSVSNL